MAWYDYLVDNAGALITGAAGAYDAYNGAGDSVTKPWMPAGAEAGLEAGVAAAKGQFEAGPNGYYPGSTVAGLDPALAAGWNDQLGTTDSLQGMANQSGSAASYLQSGGDMVGGFQMEDQIGFGIPEEYQNAIMNPIMRNLNEQVIPGIHTASQSQGAFGGSRMQQQKSDAATQATQAATDAMIQGNLQARGQSIGQRAGDISAQLTGRGQDINQLGQKANNMYNGIMANSTAMNQMLMPGQTMADVGAQRQKYDQATLDADVNRFNWNRDEGNNYVARLMKMMSGAPGGGSVTEAPDTNWMDAVLGFGAGSNLYNSAFGSPAPAPAGGGTFDGWNGSSYGVY